MRCKPSIYLKIALFVEWFFNEVVKNRGPILALTAAALFGVSPALAKLWIGEMSPILLAGLLYLGSGLGLLVLLLLQRKPVLAPLIKLSLTHKLKLFGAILSGGVLAPICLAYGIQHTTGFEVSLLLNLETVATTLMAWAIFHEHVGLNVWLGKVLLLVGAALLLFQPGAQFLPSLPGLAVVGACFFWGIDNNLTRDVDDLPPVVLAGLKGISAGLFNTLLAIALGFGHASFSQVGISFGIGGLSYGASLVLFILALRAIGSSRTSTYFASGPFFGMLLSVFALRERPDAFGWTAAALMAGGLWSLYREKHEHTHTHEPLTHSHKHWHDEHHRHEHKGDEGPEPHEHPHIHVPLTHSHPHLPDIHHRHSHS